jgi:hypothetical protein
MNDHDLAAAQEHPLSPPWSRLAALSEARRQFPQYVSMASVMRELDNWWEDEKYQPDRRTR